MNILVPIDGSKYSLEAVGIASEMAKAMNSGVRLVMVTPTISDMEVEYTASERVSLDRKLTEYGERVLEQARATMAEKGITANTSILSSNSVADAIITAAKEDKSDLIVIGSRGLGATARLLMGGVSLRVVNNAPCSVLVVRGEK